MNVDPEVFPSAFAVKGEPKKYTAKFSRTFEAVIEAENIVEAQKLARDVVNQFSPGVAKLLSILPEGYVDPDNKPPVGPRSPDAPTPGTPVVKQEILVDQIAKAA